MNEREEKTTPRKRFWSDEMKLSELIALLLLLFIVSGSAVVTGYVLSGSVGIRCDRVYKSIHKHDDFCYLSFRPKHMKKKVTSLLRAVGFS